MADTLSADLNDLYPLIYEATVLALRSSTVLAATVRGYNDQQGVANRIFSQYALVTAAAVAENADLSSTQFSKSSTATLTPGEAGGQIVLHDRTVRTSPQIWKDAALELGLSMGTKIDADIAATFSGFTLGSVGSQSVATTFGNLFAAKAILKKAGIMGPYYCALHEYQWFQMANSVSLEQTLKNTPEVIKEELARNYYVGTLGGDIHIVTSGNIPLVDGDGDVDVDGYAVGAMYPESSIALDTRNPVTLEPFRSPKGRKTELNISADYATGLAYPGRGVVVQGLSPLPA